MRIHFNQGALVASGALGQNQRAMDNTLNRLSTGLRINRASDDAAGLAVSERMRSQVKGLNQATRNTQDAIAMMQIAEGALDEIHNILQRGRELALQASSDTLTSTDRSYLQQEVGALMEELDRVNDATQYNTKQLFGGGVDSDTATAITEGLQSHWLDAAEQLIQTQYGLSASNIPLKIILESGGAGGVAAYVQANYNVGTGKAVDGTMELHVDVDDFVPAYDASTNIDGGSAPFYSDRIIAHEMVHAIMGVTMDFYNLPTWFKEGAAELLHGAKERVDTDTTLAGGIANLASSASLAGGWAGDSAHYSTAYLAALQLDQDAVGGFSAILGSLQAGNSLDTAIASNTSYSSTADFIAQFDSGDYASAYTTMQSYSGTGAINNPNASASAVVPNGSGTATEDPLSGFIESWEPVSEPFKFQVGANAVDQVDQLEFSITAVSAQGLGLESVSVDGQTAAQGAISSFDSAIDLVSQKRADIGAFINRLEHAVNNLKNAETQQQDAESRIRDIDFAQASTDFSRQQILQQSGMAMLSQANQNSSYILNLLGN